MRASSRLARAALLALLLALSLSACVREGRDIALNSDGSASYTLTLGFLKQVVSSAGSTVSASMQQFAKDIAAKGGSTRTYDDDTYTYWAFSRPCHTIADLNAALGVLRGGASQSPTTTPTEHLTVQQSEGFFANTYHLSGVLDFGSTSKQDQATRDLFATAKEWLSITMPNWVTSHQGGSVHGNTVTWELHYGDTVTVDTVGGGYNIPHLLFLAAGALALLALLALGVILGWRLRTRQRLPLPVA